MRIWQPPGDRNALGRIRFNFPNKFLVYQHDTPDKHLFAHEKRAYSHGCMRVRESAEVRRGAAVAGAAERELHARSGCRRCSAASEVNINFPQNIPVHLTYQTAFVDDAGKLQIRDDVYGRDARMLAILKGSDRKMADIAVDRPRGSSTAPVRVAPGTFGSAGGGFGNGGFSNGGGFSFFERLFGGTPEPAPKPRARVGANERRTTPR